MSNTVYARCKKCGYRMSPRLPGNRNIKVAETGTAYCYVCCGYRWWESTLNEPFICNGTMSPSGVIVHDGDTCSHHEEAWEQFYTPPVLEALLDEAEGIPTPPKVVTSEIHIRAKANEFLSKVAKVDTLVAELNKVADALDNFASVREVEEHDDVEYYLGKAQGMRLAAKYVERAFK